MVPALVTGCVGCSVGGCGAVPNGLAANGEFHYECVGPADRECDDREPFTFGGQLPRAPLARGARFRLVHAGAGGPVRAVSDDAVANVGGVMAARRSGDVGFFVEAGEEIEDALRLSVLEPDRIGIEPLGARLGRLSVSAGGALPLRVVAFCGEMHLAGSVPATCSVDDPSVATVAEEQVGVCAVRGIRTGMVRVRAATGALTAEVVVEVEGVADGGPLDAGADG